MTTSVRDLRESKNMSQTDAANACGLTFSRYERIEMGSPRTTEAEVKAVLAALRKEKKRDKKLVGRPFADKAKQAAVEAARAKGESVDAVIHGEVPAEPAPAPKPKRSRSKAKNPGTEAAIEAEIRDVL